MARSISRSMAHGEENLLINKDVRTDNDEYTHQYVFIFKPDGTFDIQVDGTSKKKGDVKEFWDFELPKEINDPDISKPDDWVEDRMIVDSEAEKPEDWDDDDDGEWEAPMIDNPDYKGPWTAPMIDNPDYKGPWEHPQIPNPDYKEIENPHFRLPINYIGFDLWQVKSGTLFGDIILADAEEDIKSFIWTKAMHDEEKDAKDEFDNPPSDAEGDEDEGEDMDELGEDSGISDGAVEEECADGDEECTKKNEGATTHDEL